MLECYFKIIPVALKQEVNHKEKWRINELIKWFFISVFEILPVNNAKSVNVNEIQSCWLTVRSKNKVEITLNFKIQTQKGSNKRYIYFNTDTQYATFWEIPFIKPQNDT